MFIIESGPKRARSGAEAGEDGGDGARRRDGYSSDNGSGMLRLGTGTHTSWPVAMFHVFRNSSTAGDAFVGTLANATVPIVFM